jgi:hypothetical protein
MDIQSMPTVPFGKHKGKPVTDLLNDVPYLEWCKQQEWFKKYQIVYNICVNQTIINGNQNSKTPEHNKLQNMFLEKQNILRIWNTFVIPFNFTGHKPLNLISHKTEFEGKFNWDCVIKLHYNSQCLRGKRCCSDQFSTDSIDVFIEIKTLLGDDYPCVLRKMKTQIELTENKGKEQSGCYFFNAIWLLVIKEYDSAVTSKDVLRKIFSQSKIKIIFVNELFYDSIENTTSTQITEQINKQITEQGIEQITEQNTEQNIEQNVEQTTEQITEQTTEQTTEQNIRQTRGIDIREFFGKSNINRNIEQKIEKTDTPKLKEENQMLKEKLLHAEDKIRQLEKEIELFKLNSNSM